MTHQAARDWAKHNGLWMDGNTLRDPNGTAICQGWDVLHDTLVMWGIVRGPYVDWNQRAFGPADIRREWLRQRRAAR